VARLFHRAALLGLLFTIACPAGCAIDNVDRKSLGIYAPAYPIVSPYSRNGLVCYPTMVGNMIGMVPVSPLVYFEDFYSSYGPERFDPLIRRSLDTIIMTPVLAGGAATGTLFLPFSYLVEGSPCGIH
jgi:hypothetical protein